MKVFSEASNPLLWRILIAAKYNKVDISQASAEGAKDKSPLGKFPVLETSEGTIFESNAIVRHVARSSKGQLYGNNDWEAAQVEQFICLTVSEIDLPAAVWVYPILGYIANNSVATQKAKGDIRKVLDYLNKHLLTRTFLVGERITLADIVVSMSLYYLFQKVLDPAFRKPYTNATRWFLTCVNQPEFKAVVGDFTICEKAEVAPEHFQEPEKKEEKPKAEKPKKEEKPKAEKPKPKPKDDEEEEDDEFAEKDTKKANVLDSLPPTTFNLDEWKRTYSNAKDTRKDACSWFWEKLDKEGYSIWFCDYKYNDECEKIFMTCNLLGGWIQRLDKLRKYGFGSLAIFGEEPKLSISGCWLFRGADVPQEMRETDDYEQYTWRKADLNDVATRELVNDFWAWDGSFGGSNNQFNQGKIFK